MKISTETLAALKTFSEINQSIVLRKGNLQKTVALAKNILAEVSVPDIFPKTVGIYDLSELLTIFSMMPDAEIEFGDTCMIISDENMKTKFVYSNISNIHPEVPEKSVDEIMPDSDVEFVVQAEQLSSALKMAGAMNLEDVQFTTHDGKIIMRITDLSSTSSNNADIVICDYAGAATFEFNYKAERLSKLMSDNYEVKISRRLVSRFTGSNIDSDYLISLEASSSYAE